MDRHILLLAFSAIRSACEMKSAITYYSDYQLTTHVPLNYIVNSYNCRDYQPLPAARLQRSNLLS